MAVLMAGALGGVMAGARVGVAVGVAFGVAFGVAGGVAFGVAGGAAGGVAGGVANAALIGVALGAAGRRAFGVAIGVAFGAANAALIGVAAGAMAGVAAGVASMVGYFRPFMYFIEVPSTFWTLLRARRQPQYAAHCLRYSLAYWDEAMPLPQPFLTPLLVLAGEQGGKAGREAIFHVATNTLQRRAATNALLELDGRDLLRRRTVEAIAQLPRSSSWLPSVAANKTGENPDRVSGDLSSDQPFGELLRQRRSLEARQRCLQISADVAAALSATSNYQKLTALNRARRQLDDLRQFVVVGLRGRESQVFTQVAQQWLDAVNAEVDRLTEEARVEERIPNPYVAPRPLRPGDDVFVGRTGVFRFVEEHFLRSDQNVPIVLYGQPRIGKSSLLRHFTTSLSTNLIPIYVDMQGAAQVGSTSGLVFNLADTIAQELARRGVSVPTPSFTEYAAEPFIFFGKFLDAVEAAIGAPGNRVILALDEFEEIERKLTEGKISRDLMPYLRNMMQHRQGIALLFAGTHNLDEMIQDYWIPYFRSAVPCKVSYLDEPDARKLVTNPIEEFPLDYELDAVELLLRETHCHPCLIQLACSALVDHENAHKSRHASVEDVKHALTKTLETGEYVFRGVWEWIPTPERAVLSELANEEQSTARELARSLRLSDGEVRRMVERLTEVEVVEATANGDRQPAYRFQVELFRQWVERHSIRSEIHLESARS